MMRDDENKMRYVDLMARFRPMSEEEQKDFLWIILSSMDDICDMADKAKQEKKKRLVEVLGRDFQHYQMLCDIIITPPDWMQENNMDSREFMLGMARKNRLHEEKKGEA